MLQECLRNNQHAHYTRKCLAGQVSKTVCTNVHAGGWSLRLRPTCIFLPFFLLSTFGTESSVYHCAYDLCIRSDAFIFHTPLLIENMTLLISAYDCMPTLYSPLKN